MNDSRAITARKSAQSTPLLHDPLLHDPEVIAALGARRTQLAATLKAAQLRVIALRVDLACVDRCLRLLRSDTDQAR